MSHVDDGELTAYADGAYPVDDPVALRISAHLSTCGDCRTRLEQNQDLRTRAAEILSFATPALMTTPSFESLQTQVGRTQLRPAVPLAWAATVVLALGIGWFGRDAWEQPGMTRTAAIEEVAPTPTQQQEADVPITVPFAPPPAASSAARERTPQSNAAREPQLAATDDDAAADLAAGAVAGDAARAAGAEEAPAASIITGEIAKQTLTLQPGFEYITAGEAEARGLQIPRIPELPIARIGLSPTGHTVDQTLPDGKVVTLAIGPAVIESELRASAAKTAAAPTPPPVAPQAQRAEAAEANQVIGVRRDSRLITISGPVDPDSLRVLLGKVR